MIQSLASRITQARTDAGFSQAALARASGLTRTTLHGMETGHTSDPLASSLRAIAVACQVTTDWLVGLAPHPRGTPPPPPRSQGEAQALRALRTALDWTVARMADTVGVDQQSYCRYERGARPMPADVLQLVRLIARRHHLPEDGG